MPRSCSSSDMAGTAMLYQPGTDGAAVTDVRLHGSRSSQHPESRNNRTHWIRDSTAPERTGSGVSSRSPGSGAELLRLAAVGDELPRGAGLQAPGRGREGGQHEQQERDDVHAGAVEADASDGE